MKNYHQEEVLGKAYDSRLMKRLLTYARPYWVLILICIFLLLFITVSELAQPYLIKVAIDDHINAFDHPLVAFSPGEEPMSGLEHDGKVLIREDHLEDSYPTKERYQTVYRDRNYYLVPAVIHEPGRREDYSVQKIEGEIFFEDLEGNLHPGYHLSLEEISNLRQQDLEAVVRIGLLYLAIIVAAFGIHYLQVYLLHYTALQIIYNIREEIFTHIEGLSLSFFDQNPVGRLVTRVTNDTETLNEMYTGVLVNLFKDLFMLLGIVIVMISMNWRLALISFTVLPLILLSTVLFRLKIRDAYRQVRLRLARINSSLQENLSGMRLIQIFHRQRKEFEKFKEINNKYLQANLKQINIYAIFRPFMDFLYSLALAILIWYGGARVMGGILEFGVLYAFINYIRRFFRPINDLTEKYNILQSAMAAAERIFQILDTEEKIENPASPVALDTIRGKIEFKDVWFSYDQEEWVLKDINLRVEPGETIALVGATGAGKTSLTRLITRFYDIQEGEILLDGVNIKEYNKKDLRKKIGVVLQDVFLFTGDIQQNIRLNNQEISDREVREAASKVNIDSYIQSLPQKYRQPVTERGSTLSAGQRQLLAFARALAFDPKILVLDEATANIDTETEILIQQALERLIEGRTTIVVAHRLSTIQNADKIVVMHKGEIKEMGSHQELLEEEGIYYDLYRLQYSKDLKNKGERPQASA